LAKAAAITALDGTHSSEQLEGRNGGIVVGKPVAARDESRIIVAVCTGYHTVREQTPFARVKHDLP
jgi:hypothetical protein